MTTHASQPSSPSAQDRAAEVAGTTWDHAEQMADAAKDQAADVAHDAVNQARDLLDEVRTSVRAQIGAQRTNLAQTLDKLASELRQMAEHSDTDGPATEAVRQVSARMETLRSALEHNDVVTDIRRFARRRPGAFLLTCVAAGVLAGRLTRGAAAGRSRDDGPGPEVSEQEWRRTYPEVDYRSVSAPDEPGYVGRGVAGYVAGGTGVEPTSDPDLWPSSDPLGERAVGERPRREQGPEAGGR